MSILRSNERKYDSNKLKQHNVIPYINLILKGKFFSGSSLIQSLIQKKITQIKIETSVIHILDEVSTAFLVVQC